MVSFESTDPVEQFLIEVHNLRTADGKICNYHIGLDLQDEIRIARILVAKMIAHHLEHSGQYVTNDASREAAIREAVSAEREACAQICEGRNRDGDWFAAEIRARGSNERRDRNPRSRN